MTPADFRSDPSETPEGRGLARRAWEAYVKKVEPVTKAATPVLEPVAMAWGRKRAGDMIGFWTLWHVFGGFEGLETRYGMHRATIWRKVAQFRQMFGEHPDVYRFEGITIDSASFWKAALEAEKRKG